MIIEDKVYGQEKITEPILIELLTTPSILRLKNISQFGIPDKYYYKKFINFSRYEHSVGVMIFLRRIGANIEEQIAGLLHDVSHTAFSHIIDAVVMDMHSQQVKENFQDTIHEKFIKKTEIPSILERYNLNSDRIINLANFNLLDREIPDLCADRVDYALREFNGWMNRQTLTRESIDKIIVYQNEIIFKDQEKAKSFAVGFLDVQTEHWGGYEAVLRYYLFSKALKIAINERVLFLEDFYQSEDFVLNKFNKVKNDDFHKIINQLSNNNKISDNYKKTGEQKIFKKFRYVDPKVLIGQEIKKLSDIDFEFKENLRKRKRENEEGFMI